MSPPISGLRPKQLVLINTNGTPQTNGILIGDSNGRGSILPFDSNNGKVLTSIGSGLGYYYVGNLTDNSGNIQVSLDGNGKAYANNATVAGDPNATLTTKDYVDGQDTYTLSVVEATIVTDYTGDQLNARYTDNGNNWLLLDISNYQYPNAQVNRVLEITVNGVGVGMAPIVGTYSINPSAYIAIDMNQMPYNIDQGDEVIATFTCWNYYNQPHG